MSVTASIRSQLVPINPAGYPFIGTFALASLVLFWLWPPLGWIGTVLTIWCALFFRDPPRVTAAREGGVVGPAAGPGGMVNPPSAPPAPGFVASPPPRSSMFMTVVGGPTHRNPG